MAKKKELTEEETIAELQKKIDAYNRRVAAERQTGGGRQPRPGDSIMKPQPVKPGKPGKPVRPGDLMKPQPVKPKPGDGMKYKQPVKPGKGIDKVYRPDRDGPKGVPAEQRQKQLKDLEAQMKKRKKK